MIRYFSLSLAIVLAFFIGFITTTSEASSGTFPSLSLPSLAQQSVQIPNRSKDKTIVIVAFRHQLQPMINPWLLWLQSEATTKNIAFYEVPVVAKKYTPYKKAIVPFMKRQLPNASFYKHTVPFYSPFSSLSNRLNISEKAVSIFVLNKRGVIQFHTQGGLTASKKKAIQSYL
jgi:hypothetical protein